MYSKHRPLFNHQTAETHFPWLLFPETVGRRAAFFQKIINTKDASVVSNFVENDNIDNGQVNKRSIFSPDTEISLGDTVKVEMRCISTPAYTYSYTLSQISGEGPIGGTIPSNPPSNIAGSNVLGIFMYIPQTWTQVVVVE
ncbi:DUF4249 family protein [Gracilimonas mengyeensis]|uniref:Uncharacterized protein n=1 Tax=Gracilimonas mengyeensis TaxID=1302730 RepID=A0A521BTU5_9BACT|nr:hypothetical protein [Gracilimonas mengyeensis]SMO50592.1 hypothetical protein SAMN06265219_10380 [Gracilimonas mengyeensis]